MDRWEKAFVVASIDEHIKSEKEAERKAKEK